MRPLSWEHWKHLYSMKKNGFTTGAAWWIAEGARQLERMCRKTHPCQGGNQ